jgi:hypothetical protein
MRMTSGQLPPNSAKHLILTPLPGPTMQPHYLPRHAQETNRWLCYTKQPSFNRTKYRVHHGLGILNSQLQ